jgi:hypothetical protein
MLSYVDNQIPHIPISAEGLDKTNLYAISTTNWQPYTWSINNVALAEQLHTSLAFWQGGQADKAYTMWESALIESMYLGASPGGFEQFNVSGCHSWRIISRLCRPNRNGITNNWLKDYLEFSLMLWQEF